MRRACYYTCRTTPFLPFPYIDYQSTLINPHSNIIDSTCARPRVTNLIST